MQKYMQNVCKNICNICRSLYNIMYCNSIYALPTLLMESRRVRPPAIAQPGRAPCGRPTGKPDSDLSEPALATQLATQARPL